MRGGSARLRGLGQRDRGFEPDEPRPPRALPPGLETAGKGEFTKDNVDGAFPLAEVVGKQFAPAMDATERHDQAVIAQPRGRFGEPPARIV